MVNVSREALIVIYDLLHYMTLHGERLQVSEVSEFVARATGKRSHRAKADVSLESKDRAFCRLLRNLRRLSIAATVETMYSTGVQPYRWLTVTHAAHVQRRVSALLDAAIPRADRGPLVGREGETNGVPRCAGDACRCFANGRRHLQRARGVTRGSA